MSAINQLTRLSTLTAGDLFAVFSQTNGQSMAVAASVVLAYIQANLPASGLFETQYSAPNATGFTVTIDPTTAGSNVYLNLTPLAGYAAGTIVLPPATEAIDGQEVLISCTQSVAALTFTSTGATINGAPASFAANGFARMRYDSVLSTWQRVG